MRAYVVVTVGPGKAREVAQKIASLPGVKMSNACWGSPDNLDVGPHLFLPLM